MHGEKLTVICPGAVLSGRFSETLHIALSGYEVEMVSTPDDTRPLTNRRILLAVCLDEAGMNSGLCLWLAFLRSNPNYLAGSIAGILVDGASELYTKTTARELVLAANLAGGLFPGHSLVEATGSLLNFAVQAKIAGCSLLSAYQKAAEGLVKRIVTFSLPVQSHPKILALHASNHHTSNTMALWSRVKQLLEPYCDISEIGLRNGAVVDCSGCPYTMCLHFGEKGGCFYGGVMVDEVYPSLKEADALVMLCPNYNDALSANLSAFINRLTALYRTTSFDRKALFGIVVSGYSGGDIVAAQLVSALCMNKGFLLPPGFCLMETANDPGSALALPGIDVRIDRFAEAILDQLLAR